MAKKNTSSDNNSLVPQRVSVTLPGTTADELGNIAQNAGITMSEAARRSIKRDLALRKLEKRGGDVLVRFPDGDTAYILPDE